MLKRLEYRTKEWDPDFRNYTHNLVKTENKPVIIAGDLNCAHNEIDIANPSVHERTAGFTREEREEFTKLLNEEFIDTFRYKYPNKVKYTYWSTRFGHRSKSSGWRLDYFLLSKKHKDLLIDSEIYEQYRGSDHCPIILNLNIK